MARFDMLEVDVLALQDGGPSSLGLTLDVFDAANRCLGGARRVRWRVLCHLGDSVALRHGVSVAAEPWAKARPASVVIVLGMGAGTPEAMSARIGDADVSSAASWVRVAGRQGALIAASCTGAFVLAEAGVLNGRQCTTTWWLSRVLRRRCPTARVTADRMVVRDGPIWTAGAALGHLDLMLSLARELLGEDVADEVGRRIAAQPRPSQAPFMSMLGIAGEHADMAQIEAAFLARLDSSSALKQVADELIVSDRTLARRIQLHTGLNPGRYLQKLRLEAAMRLVSEGRAPLGQIAHEVGLADAAGLHRLFVRHTGKPPGSFRSATS